MKAKSKKTKSRRFHVAIIDGGGIDSPLTGLLLLPRKLTERQAVQSASAGHDAYDVPSDDERAALVKAVAPYRLVAAHWHERSCGWDLVLEEVH